MRDDSRYREVARIGLQVAAALDYAHRQGIVHRDVKPANILIDRTGAAWVADFGLAKILEAEPDSLTAPGDIVGTLRYMAPERFDGQSDARGDIDALGTAPYELLLLRPAFTGSDRTSLIDRVLRGQRPPPRSIDRQIPRDLETIILKAMGCEPASSYPTPADLAEDFRRHLAGEAIEARRIGPAERLLSWSRRNPLAASLASAVATLLLVIVVATAISSRREYARRIEADQARQDAEESLIHLREAITDGATVRRAIANERANLVADPTNRDAQGSLDALYFQQGVIQRRTGQMADAVATTLMRRDLNPGEPDRLYQIAMDLADTCISLGSTPLLGSLDAADVEKAAGLAVETLGRAIRAGLRTDHNLSFDLEENLHFRSLSVAITPDGRRAVSGGEDGCLIEWDLIDGKRRQVLWGQWWTVRAVAISADGRRVVAGGPRDRLLSWDLASGQELYRFPRGVGDSAITVAFSRDGRYLVTGAIDKFARVWWLTEETASARSLGVVGHWDAALEACERAVRAAPDDISLLTEATAIPWRLGRWSKLVGQHDHLRRIDPADKLLYLNSARVLLMAGDLAGYRRLCAALPGMAADPQATRNDWMPALAGLLRSDSTADLGEAVRLVERASKLMPGGTGSDRRPGIDADRLEVSLVAGLAADRAGRPREAIATLLPLALEHPEWSIETTTWPILAMAYHALDDSDEAGKWLAKTQAIRHGKTPAFGRDPRRGIHPRRQIWNWIDFEILAREATEVVGESAC